MALQFTDLYTLGKETNSLQVKEKTPEKQMEFRSMIVLLILAGLILTACNPSNDTSDDDWQKYDNQ